MIAGLIHPPNATFLTQRKLPMIAAGLWGVAVWFSVSVTFIAAGLALAAVLTSGSLTQRWQQAVSCRGLHLSLGLFAWILIAFLFHPGGEHAYKIFFHVLLFNLTILTGLMLTQDEARVAWLAFVITSGIMLLLLFISYAIVVIPHFPGFRDLMVYDGNKSIRAGLLTGVFAMFWLSYLLWRPKSFARFMFGLVLCLYGLVVVAVFNYSKTAMILTAAAVFIVFIHKKPHIRPTLISVVLGAILLLTLFGNSKHLQHRIGGDYQQLMADVRQGKPSVSSGLRYYFYKFSLKKMEENPIVGMGPGTWRRQWSKQPYGFKDIANPHCDYLLMGSESGVLGLVLLLAVYAFFFLARCRNKSFWGSVAITSTLIAGGTALFNAGMRDAVFCVSLVWLMATSYRASS